MSASKEKVDLKNVIQVCVVVKNIRKAVESYWNLFAIGPWKIYTFQPPDLTNATLHGKLEKYSMKIAITMIGNMMWELIEPLEGPSIYKEFLEERGEGIHHVHFAVDNYDQTVAALKKQGINILMDGSWKGITYAYLDTERELGAIFEISKPLDAQLPPPEAVYPPSNSGG
ncbi:MAG: VOC family protein [Thermodesulfobacteriota bacterium]|jgi:catechol 2,3-dioxygenase-like lactoylglutathione lyase family enzyme